MADIVTNIKNYKCVKSFAMEVQDANLIIISAKNERGKSSIINLHKELISAKKLTPDPLSRGEKQGSAIAQLPDKNGNPVTISVLFDEANKYAFTLIDSEGKKITSQEKIREVMGYTTFMTVEEFTRNCLTAEGKRKIMTNIIYKLLPQEDVAEINNIDKSLKTDSELYKSILALQRELETGNIQLKAFELSADEKIIAEQSDDVEKAITEKSKLCQQFEEANTNVQLYSQNLSNYKQKKESLATATVNLEEWKKRKLAEIEAEYNKSLEEIEAETKALVKPTEAKLPFEKEKYDKLKEEVTELTKAQGMKASVTEKVNKAKAIKDTIAPKQLTLMQKEQEKQDIKKRKIEILSKIDIAGLTFDEDTFYIDGFEIADEQLSESKRALVLINLLCRPELNEAKLIFVGNLSIFDKQRIGEVVKICEQNDKIPFFEVVSDQNDIRVITELTDL